MDILDDIMKSWPINLPIIDVHLPIYPGSYNGFPEDYRASESGYCFKEPPLNRGGFFYSFLASQPFLIKEPTLVMKIARSVLCRLCHDGRPG